MASNSAVFNKGDGDINLTNPVINIVAANIEYPSTSGAGANGTRPDRTSKNDSFSILNGVWMCKDTLIESVFFKDLEAFNIGKSRFNNHICLNPSLPGQILARQGDTVQLKIGFKQPPDMPIEPDKQRLEITNTVLSKYWHKIYFKPNPGPDNLQLGQPCKASYKAEVFTCEGKTTTGGFSDEFDFSWPLTSNQRDRNDERRARPGNDCQQIIGPNLRASGNADTGRCGEHIDQSRRDVASRHRYDGEASSGQNEKHFTDIMNMLEQTANQKYFKVRIVGVDGGAPELGGCKIDVRPGLVEKPTEIEICLDNDPNHSPDSVVAVSHIFKCKPSKFEAPVRVKLISYLFPKPGKQLRVRIMSKTGGAKWKPIQEVILGPGNEIEYIVPHFCWHVAVVSEEDEKDGEYHLFNDIWMHPPTGMILSVFWKDWFSLTNGSKQLEVDHKRVISLPGVVIASVGDTVAADIECLDHPEMKIPSVDGSDGRIEIGSAMRKKKFFAMLFRPDPHLESLKATNRFEVINRANVINGEGQRTDGGFSVPLHVTPSLLRSIGCSAVPAEQERNDDQPSTSYQPDAVKQTVTHAAEASGLKMIGPIEESPSTSGTTGARPRRTAQKESSRSGSRVTKRRKLETRTANEVSFESEVRYDHQATMPFQSEIRKKTVQLVRSLSNESELSQDVADETSVTGTRVARDASIQSEKEAEQDIAAGHITGNVESKEGAKGISHPVAAEHNPGMQDLRQSLREKFIASKNDSITQMHNYQPTPEKFIASKNDLITAPHYYQPTPEMLHSRIPVWHGGGGSITVTLMHGATRVATHEIGPMSHSETIIRVKCRGNMSDPPRGIQIISHIFDLAMDSPMDADIELQTFCSARPPVSVEILYRPTRPSYFPEWKWLMNVMLGNDRKVNFRTTISSGDYVVAMPMHSFELRSRVNFHLIALLYYNNRGVFICHLCCDSQIERKRERETHGFASALVTPQPLLVKLGEQICLELECAHPTSANFGDSNRYEFESDEVINSDGVQREFVLRDIPDKVHGGSIEIYLKFARVPTEETPRRCIIAWPMIKDGGK